MLLAALLLACPAPIPPQVEEVAAEEGEKVPDLFAEKDAQLRALEAKLAGEEDGAGEE